MAKRHLALLVVYDLVNLPLLAAWLFMAASNRYDQNPTPSALIIGTQALLVLLVNAGLIARKRWGPLCALAHALIGMAASVFSLLIPRLPHIWRAAFAHPKAHERFIAFVGETVGTSLPLLAFGLIALLAARAMRSTRTPGSAA